MRLKVVIQPAVVCLSNVLVVVSPSLQPFSCPVCRLRQRCNVLGILLAGKVIVEPQISYAGVMVKITPVVVMTLAGFLGDWSYLPAVLLGVAFVAAEAET